MHVNQARFLGLAGGTDRQLSALGYQQQRLLPKFVPNWQTVPGLFDLLSGCG